MKHLAATDATGLSLWLNKYPASRVRDAGIIALTSELSNDPYAQKLWASQVSDESLRKQLEASIGKNHRQ